MALIVRPDLPIQTPWQMLFKKDNSSSDFNDVSELSRNLLERPIDFWGMGSLFVALV